MTAAADITEQLAKADESFVSALGADLDAGRIDAVEAYARLVDYCIERDRKMLEAYAEQKTMLIADLARDLAKQTVEKMLKELPALTKPGVPSGGKSRAPQGLHWPKGEAIVPRRAYKKQGR